MDRVEASVAGLCAGAWLLAAAFLALEGLERGAFLPAGFLFPLAAIVGWLAGNLYVARRKGSRSSRRLLLSLYLGGPPGFVWLYWALVPRWARMLNPVAPLWALAILAIFFLVPVTLRGLPRGGG